MARIVLGIIQARMGSTRLPGKVMLPLNCEYVLTHVVRRVGVTESIDEIVVATSTKIADDIVARYGSRAGATVFRGSESDVLDRMFHAADQRGADIVVRITSDCPLISPETIDKVVEQLVEADADYCANILDRTFPRGLDVEAFTFESFGHVHKEASEPHHREHVTTYYREKDDQFDLTTVTSDEVFDEPWMQNRNELRLVLDEADDYELLRRIYEEVDYDETVDLSEAIQYVDEHELGEINQHVEQKEV